MTVLTAISIAGGFTYRAVEDYAGITRDVGSNALQYRAPSFALVQPYQGPILHADLYRLATASEIAGTIRTVKKRVTERLIRIPQRITD